MYTIAGETLFNYRLIHPRTGFWTASFEAKKLYPKEVPITITNEFLGNYIGEVVEFVELFDRFKYIVSPRIKTTVSSTQFMLSPVSAIASSLIGAKSAIVSGKIVKFITMKGNGLDNLYSLSNIINDGIHINKSGLAELESSLIIPVVPNKFLDKSTRAVKIPNQVIAVFPSNIDRMEVTEREMILYGFSI